MKTKVPQASPKNLLDTTTWFLEHGFGRALGCEAGLRKLPTPLTSFPFQISPWMSTQTEQAK